MAKILFLSLLSLIILRSNNVQAYCYATQWASYGPVYSSLGVAEGTTLQACQQLACSLFSGIPECGQPPVPVCQDIVENQTLSCEPNHSGAVNQTRTKTCSNNQWTDWVTTSNNCSPNPPTCISSVQERQTACQQGFTGTITEQQITSCPTPYSQPVVSPWVESTNLCTKSITNPTNVASPVNPASPINATVTQEQMPIAPAPEPPAEPPPMEAPAQDTPASPAPTVETTTPAPAAPPPSVPSVPAVSATPLPTTSNGTTQTTSPPQIPAGKSLVQGFGLVMSLEILNKPMQIQQTQLNDALAYQQELQYEFAGNQGILLELLSENAISRGFWDISTARWDSLRRNNDLQPCYSCD